jgi:hypothetical protein
MNAKQRSRSRHQDRMLTNAVRKHMECLWTPQAISLFRRTDPHWMAHLEKALGNADCWVPDARSTTTPSDAD